FAVDRELGCAEPGGPLAGGLAYHLDAPPDVLAELGLALRIDAPVCLSVGPDLSVGAEPRDDGRVTLGGHPYQEERRRCLQLVEQCEQCVDLPWELGPRLVPILASEPAVDELVPVLDVDAEDRLLCHVGSPLWASQPPV